MASADAVARPQRSLDLETEVVGVLKAIQQHGVLVGDRRLISVATLARSLGRAKSELLDRRQLLGRALVNLAEHGYVSFLQFPIRIHDDDIIPSASVPWSTLVVLREPAEFAMLTGTVPMPGTPIGSVSGGLGKLPIVPQLVNATLARACRAPGGVGCTFGFTPKIGRVFAEVSIDAFAADDAPTADTVAKAISNTYAEGLGPDAARVRKVGDASVDEDLALEIRTHPSSAYLMPTPARRVGGSFDPRSSEMEDAPAGLRVLSRTPPRQGDAPPADACAVSVLIRPDAVAERMLEHADAIRYGGN